MRRLLFNNTVATGFAIFSMFFGAGNVVFPLVIGRYAGDKNFYAVVGFLATAVIVPLIGLISMVLFNGDYKKFFGRLGRWPGNFVIFLSMSIIGPLAAIPRCIALSFTTVKSFLDNTFLENINLFYFSLISCIIIYILTVRKNNIVDILGRVLSPILLGALTLIIIKGFWGAPSAATIFGRRRVFLLEGLIEGYNTMDIFAGFFFSAVVIAGLKKHFCGTKKISQKELISKTLSAGLIGVSLLGLIYTGFSYLSSFYAEHLAAVEPDALISAISFRVLGNYAGIIACIAVSLACLTTAIALSLVFTDFLRTQVLKERLGYRSTLLISMAITFAVSNIGFAGIVRMIIPVLTVCYPALIVLAIVNIAYKLWGVRIVKTPVFAIFAFAFVYNLMFWIGVWK